MEKETVILERSYAAAGSLILKEGDYGNCAYLIQSGSVRVFSECNGREVVLGRLEAGQIFGEMSLIFDETRTASVAAEDDVNLIVITRQIFDQKLNNSDATVRAIVTMLTQRIVAANNVMMKSECSFDGLVQTAQIIYQNILLGLPDDKQQSFQDTVLPKLGDFFDSIEAFQEKTEN